MNDDQFNGNNSPGQWPSWLTAAVFGGLPAPWRSSAPNDIWDQSPPGKASSDRPAGGGILPDSFDRPPESAWPPAPSGAGPNPALPPTWPATVQPHSGWYRNSPSWVQSAMPLGAKVGFSPARAEPAYQPWTDPPFDKTGANSWERPQPPWLPAPVLPRHGPQGWYYPGAQLDPTPPAPPKDWRDRLHDALSDGNARYYLGPHAFEALRKLAAITQLLPGSGTVQSTQDAAQAREEAQAGNYGKAAAHFGMGTVNAGLDWLPAGKLFGAILGGMSARTFPWARLPLAEQLEKVGRSDEIWRATRLERGADGEWRFEISDKGYRVNPNAGVLDSEGYRVAPLFEHLNHPGVREAYPALAQALSRIRIDPSILSPRGMFTLGRPGQISLEVPSRSNIRSLGMHELQHGIGHHEGFARGGQPLEFMGDGPGVTYSQAHALYKRLAGEVEADNAVHRMYTMDDAARLRRSPQSTEDVPRVHQIIRFSPPDL